MLRRERSSLIGQRGFANAIHPLWRKPGSFGRSKVQRLQHFWCLRGGYRFEQQPYRATAEGMSDRALAWWWPCTQEGAGNRIRSQLASILVFVRLSCFENCHAGAKSWRYGKHPIKTPYLHVKSCTLSLTGVCQFKVRVHCASICILTNLSVWRGKGNLYAT